MKTRKIWIGIGAFVVAGTGAEGVPVLANPPAKPAFNREAMKQETARAILVAESVKPAGEAGEGGEGGEAGIDAEAAAKDPVKYNIALQVIAAHFHAGLAAYEGREMEAGAQMFAHGHSEVYAEMEDVFRQRGVKGLGEKLEAAIESATAKKPSAEVRKRVQDVLSALTAAEKAAPSGELSPAAVKAQVAADMLDRAASQFGVMLKDSNLEAYLDGLGFALAARMQADTFLPALRKQNPKAAASFDAALKLSAAAYPGIMRPATPKVGASDFLAAASAATIAANSVK